MKSLLLLIFAFISFSTSTILAAEDDVVIKAAIDDSKDADMEGIALAKKYKNTYLMRDCPIVANTESGIYHLPGQPNYCQMLVINKCADKGKCKDNRRCFDSEDEARTTEFCPKKGSCVKYRKSKSKTADMKGVRKTCSIAKK